MSDQKPREFWIDERTARFMEENGPALRTGSQAGFDVIEKSAYDALREKYSKENLILAEQNMQLRADRDLAIEALKKTIMLLEVKNGLLVAYRTGGHPKESIWKKLPKCETALEDARETLAKLQERK